MANEQQQPMSDARLEELKAKNQVKTIIVGGHYWRNQVTANDIDELLAEVSRLRAREAALVEAIQKAMPFLQELATAHVSMLDEHDVIIKVSPGRAAWVISRNHVFIEQARALLASDSADEAK